MKSITTLQKVSEQVDQLSRHCTDSMIPVPDISFDHLETIRIAGGPHSLRPIAQQSIAWRLGIPIQYLRRCPPDIQQINLEHWIRKEKNTELFFRFDGKDVRAIFTPRYTPVDHFEILERLDAMGYGPESEVQCHLDPEFMSLSILEGNQCFDIDGDRMTPGISIGNSEVGLSSLSISAFVLRLICTNGMIAETAVTASFRHVSRKILEQFPEVMTRVGSELGRQKDQFKISMKSPVDDPLLSIESFNRRFGLSKQEKDAVEWGHQMEPGRTMFDVVNAYTRASQFKGLSAESVHKLQRTGGMILSMVN